MDPISSAITLKALDGLALRATVSARNIANAQTPGYRALGVSFESALAAAATRGLSAVTDVTPQIEVAPDALAGEVRLDQELTTASATALRYAALIDVLGRRLQLHSLITGAR